MSNKYYIAESNKIDDRKNLAEEFYTKILEPEEIPYLVTNEASLYDIYAGDEFELIQKVEREYGVLLTTKHFKISFWQLLDFLKDNRKK